MKVFRGYGVDHLSFPLELLEKSKCSVGIRLVVSIRYLCWCGYLRWYNKLPPPLNSVVKATNIYYFTVSVGQDSGCGLAESSGPGSRVLGHFKAQGEESASNLTREVVGRIQFLAGRWTESLSSSLAGG